MFHSMVPTYSLDKFPVLRDFQVTTQSLLRDGFSKGHKRQLVSAPTGSGKTVLALHIIAQALMKGKRATFVCDRTTLINQTSDVSMALNMVHGVIQAQHQLRNNSYPFQIASIQTIAKRGWHDTDIIIIDECHTLHKAYTEHIGHFTGSVIGLSATPFSKGLGKIFSNLVNATTMHELTQSGVLVPMRVISATKINMVGAKTNSMGEWANKEVEVRGKEILGNVVREWKNYAEDRKTIIFGATIAHCEDLCSQFTDAGIMAAVFSSETKDDERKELLAGFKSGDIQILISVEALAKGFDVPDVGCVVDCRPLRKSLSTAIQMWGRGLRSSPNKKDCILLDHSGNIVRFLEDFTNIYFNGLDSLDDGEKLDKKIRDSAEKDESAGCPKCSRKPFFKRCMACGFELIKPSLIEHLPGVMQELSLGGQLAANDKFSIYEQIVSFNKNNGGNPETVMGRAYHQYKAITGKFPPNNFSGNLTADVPVSMAIIGKIRSLNIAYAKSNHRKAA